MAAAVPDLIGSLFPARPEADPALLLLNQPAPDTQAGRQAEQSFEKMRVKAASICAAIAGLQNNDYRKEEVLSQRLDRCMNQRRHEHGLQGFLVGVNKIIETPRENQAVFEYAYRLVEIEPALACFSSREEGMSVIAYFSEAFVEAAESGKLHEYFSPQPEVERWAASISSAVKEEFFRAFSKPTANDLFRAMLGYEVYLLDLYAKLWSDFYGLGEQGTARRTGLSVETLQTVMHALRASALRDILCDDRCRPLFKEVIDQYSKFAEIKIKPGNVSLRSRFGAIKHVFQAYSANQTSITASAAHVNHYFQTAELAGAVELAAAASGSFARQPDQPRLRTLPFGEILIVDERISPAICFHADGITHQCKIIFRLPESFELNDLSYN